MIDLVPTPRIAREGLRWVSSFGAAAVALTLARLLLPKYRRFLAPFETATWLATLYSFFTYRDPQRHTQQPDAQYIFAPADGRVTTIDEAATEPNFIGGPATVLSIAQHPFDVHIYRSPIVGRIEYVLSRTNDVLEPPYTLIGLSLDEAAAQEVLDKGTGRARMPKTEAAAAGEGRRVVVATYTQPRAGLLPVPLANLLQPAHIRAHAAHTVTQQDVLGIGRPFLNSTVKLFVPPGEVEWLIHPGQHTQAGQTVIGRFRPRR